MARSKKPVPRWTFREFPDPPKPSKPNVDYRDIDVLRPEDLKDDIPRWLDEWARENCCYKNGDANDVFKPCKTWRQFNIQHDLAFGAVCGRNNLAVNFARFISEKSREQALKERLGREFMSDANRKWCRTCKEKNYALGLKIGREQAMRKGSDTYGKK